MNITASHIQSKRRIGKLNGKAIVELVTRGGLHLIVGEGGKVYGTGPHRAVARHIAQKNEPTMEITELSKSDALDVKAMASVLPSWEAFTARMQHLTED